MRTEASAPSNIALIKYMGKTRESENLPANASLSFTLEHLRSFVVIEETGVNDTWAPLEGFQPLELSETGRKKFLNHFDRLKKHWEIEGCFTVRSNNNFPADCGLASSASSFAALTRATAMINEKRNNIQPSTHELSKLSRLGSGSSCRSFFSPFAIWDGDAADAADLNVKLEHAVLVVEPGRKPVSSSEAHLRVSTSSLFNGRAVRAETRLKTLLQNLAGGDWRLCFETCWAEFWDMHALFETAMPPFGFMVPESLKVLRFLREKWQVEGDGPLVTMDAGANIHLLFRPDQINRADEWTLNYKVYKSWG